MMNKSTNMNKMNHHLSLQTIKHIMALDILVLAWDMHKNVAGRFVAPLGHIILLPSQPVLDLKATCLAEN